MNLLYRVEIVINWFQITVFLLAPISDRFTKQHSLNKAYIKSINRILDFVFATCRRVLLHGGSWNPTVVFGPEGKAT